MTPSDRTRLVLALEAANMSVWDSRIPDDHVIQSNIFWSATGAALLGLQVGAYRQTFSSFLAAVHVNDRDKVLGTMQHAVDHRIPYELEYRVVWPDESVHWLRAKARVIAHDQRDFVRTLGVIWDVTLTKQAELELAAQKELAQITLSSIGDGLITTDAHGKTTFLNRVAEQVTGWTNDDVRDGISIEEVFPVVDERSGEMLENAAKRCLRLGQAIGLTSHSELVARDGCRIPIEDSAAPIRDPEGDILGAVVVFHDVSHERALKHELSWHAAHDPLTGLLNRREFASQVAAALATAKHDEHVTHALMYFDLDRFKIVNDTCGHNAGDALLKSLSKLLHSKLRDADFLARLGGDEFGALLLNCRLEQARQLADNLRLAIKGFRFVWDTYTFDVGASIGLVMIDHDSKSVSELLSAADQACYVAKERGRNRVHLYRDTDAMLAKRHGETLWVSRLHEAVEKSRFSLHTQPIVSLNEENRRLHAEVLIRMGDGNGELIAPGAFIPAAERYGLMPSIDRWVLETVCQRLCDEADETSFSKQGRRTVYSVNLSGVTLNEPSLYDFIVAKFNQYDVDPTRVCFEVTETAVINNLDQAQVFMSNVKKLGCQFSLDDFGSGLSSFAYLKTLPVDYLKIDGFFIRDIAENPINRAIVTAINEVGHVMGIATIAEFVENDVTLETLRSIGVDYAQGYGVGMVEPWQPVYEQRA